MATPTTSAAQFSEVVIGLVLVLVLVLMLVVIVVLVVAFTGIRWPRRTADGLGH